MIPLQFHALVRKHVGATLFIDPINYWALLTPPVYGLTQPARTYRYSRHKWVSAVLLGQRRQNGDGEERSAAVTMPACRNVADIKTSHSPTAFGGYGLALPFNLFINSAKWNFASALDDMVLGNSSNSTRDTLSVSMCAFKPKGPRSRTSYYLFMFILPDGKSSPFYQIRSFDALWLYRTLAFSMLLSLRRRLNNMEKADSASSAELIK